MMGRASGEGTMIKKINATKEIKECSHKDIVIPPLSAV